MVDEVHDCSHAVPRNTGADDEHVCLPGTRGGAGGDGESVQATLPWRIAGCSTQAVAHLDGVLLRPIDTDHPHGRRHPG